MSFGLVHHWFLLKYLIWKTFLLPLGSSRGWDTYFWITVYKKKRQLALLTNNKPYRFIWELWASSSNSSERKFTIHCTEIQNKYTQKWNCATSSQFLPSCVCVRFICTYIRIFPRSVRLFWSIAFADRSCEYIKVREYRIWDRGRAVSLMGIFVSNFRYSAFEVQVSIHFTHNEIHIFFFFALQKNNCMNLIISSLFWILFVK